MLKYFKYMMVVFLCFPLQALHSHGYVFSKANEEMHDNIQIEIDRNFLIIQYESVYFGQIAPHVRLMIDANSDNIISRQEIDSFFISYKNSLNRALETKPFYINKQPYLLHLVSVFAPSLTVDSLLAPLRLGMLFSVSGVKIHSGENELTIDPKLLFENGTHLIDMAKKQVAFTDKQHKAIGRFLQISMSSKDSLQFISTFPGRLTRNKKMVFVHGVFYDKTILNMDKSKYADIQIRFKSP